MPKASIAPKYRFLEQDHPDVVAHEVPVDGTFLTLPPVFEPVDGEAPLCDGVAPSRIGVAIRELWAAQTGKPEKQCPHGLIRAVEMIAVPSDENVTMIRRARWTRNACGRFLAPQIDVFVPLVREATINPRVAQAAQRHIKAEHGRGIVHEIQDGLFIDVIDDAHPNQISVAQTKGKDPKAYTTADEKHFVDSIALEGIREPLRGFALTHRTKDGHEGTVCETDDGWTRVGKAKATMSALMGVHADLATLHWEKSGGWEVRHVTAADIEAAWAELRFPAAAFDVWPAERAGAKKAEVTAWLGAASPAQLAVLRMMTAPMAVGILVDPHPGYRTHDVVYADMARFHEKGQRPDEWSHTDATFFRGRNVVSDLAAHGYIASDELDVFLGNTDVPFEDDAARTPYRNRLVATLDVLIKCVVDIPSVSARYRASLDAHKRFGAPRSALQAATTSAGLAATVAGLEGSGELGQFTAALARSFKNDKIRRVSSHTGTWTDQITRDLPQIVDAAKSEYQAVKGTKDANAGKLGPNQRALAIMAFVAHAMNPALINYVAPDDFPNERFAGKRYPSSMTLTGRGGRGGVDKVEAHVIVFHAAQSLVGIDELATVIEAVIDQDTPVVPIDPNGADHMTEEWLRRRWQKTPTVHGDPIQERDDSDDDRDPDGGDTDGNDNPDRGDNGPDLNEPDNWLDEFISVNDQLRAVAAQYDALASVAACADVANIDEDDWDPDDEDLPRLIDIHGVDKSHLDDLKALIAQLHDIQDRANDGYMVRLERS